MTEAFSFIDPIVKLNGFKADWIPRQPDIDVLGDRDFALKNLAPLHDSFISERFPERVTRHHAEQVHGNRISVITQASHESAVIHPKVDGLVTNLPNQLLAIYVADCAAIYLADPTTKSAALLHSGKKGTESNILSEAVRKMTKFFGTDPKDLVCVVSPCIRPPDYDIDFAGTIAEQAASVGIKHFYDSCENTASDLNQHYSYRIEEGRTGRMLALLSITSF
ncbi:MAG: laccase domain-containing protein [Akkermansiaceae bacterium]